MSYKVIDERIITRVRGVIVNLLLMIDVETYANHIVDNDKKGRKVTYLVVFKALHRMLHCALLFYNMYRTN